MNLLFSYVLLSNLFKSLHIVKSIAIKAMQILGLLVIQDITSMDKTILVMFVTNF